MCKSVLRNIPDELDMIASSTSPSRGDSAVRVSRLSSC